MKQLPLKTEEYQRLQEEFKQWLATLGYSESARNSYPVYVRELLHELEQQDITTFKEIHSKHLRDFIFQLKKERRNQRHGGSLSIAYLNHIISGLRLFTEYLEAAYGHSIQVNLTRPKKSIETRQILTRQEVEALYESCNLDHPMGLRDRAMLAVYYGCGLRKSEGSALNVADIDLERRRVHIKNGKGDKERWVPMSETPYRDIKNYLWNGRHWLLYHHHTNYPTRRKADIDAEAFFLNVRGRRMEDFTWRLRKLQERAGIEKRVTLHGLRHSIATHLLQDGMEMKYIAQFLGHRSLESTQIYTHLSDEL